MFTGSHGPFPLLVASQAVRRGKDSQTRETSEADDEFDDNEHGTSAPDETVNSRNPSHDAEGSYLRVH
jgi:hypothetical protein